LSGKDATGPRRAFCKTLVLWLLGKDFFEGMDEHGAAGISLTAVSDQGLCPWTPPPLKRRAKLLSALRALGFAHCGERPGALPLDPAAFRERRAKAFSALRARIPALDSHFKFKLHIGQIQGDCIIQSPCILYTLFCYFNKGFEKSGSTHKAFCGL